MSTDKPQAKGKPQPAEQRDELNLEAETIKDLDPREHGSEVRGGYFRLTKSPSCTGGGGDGGTGMLQSDVRLKEAVRPLGGSLARLRRLRSR